MARIEDEQRARRLARAIATDIRLYNEDKLSQGRAGGNVLEVLAAEIAEGRALFCERVSESLDRQALFDDAMASILIAVESSEEAEASPATRAGKTLIEDEGRARQLARALAADIKIYNEDKVAAGRAGGNVLEVLAAEIDEARALFLERVSEALDRQALFDGAMASILTGAKPEPPHDPQPWPAQLGSDLWEREAVRYYCPRCRLAQPQGEVCEYCGVGQPSPLGSVQNLAKAKVWGATLLLCVAVPIMGGLTMLLDHIYTPSWLTLSLGGALLIGAITPLVVRLRRLQVPLVPRRIIADDAGGEVLRGTARGVGATTQDPSGASCLAAAVVFHRGAPAKVCLWRLHAAAFLVEVEGGEQALVRDPIWIAPESAGGLDLFEREAMKLMPRLGDKPGSGFSARELVLHEGDTVEVRGLARRETVVELAHHYDLRRGGQTTVLSGSPERPLVVRIVTSTAEDGGKAEAEA